MKKIRLRISQVVHYDQTVEVTDEQYEKLESASYEELDDSNISPFIDLLDLRDISAHGIFDDYYWDLIE